MNNVQHVDYYNNNILYTRELSNPVSLVFSLQKTNGNYMR